jgi:hypothetical protein
MNEENKKSENDVNDSDNEEEVRIIEEYVEGFWNCSNCGAKCKGSEQQCSQCGAIRGENVEFYTDDDAPVIADEEQLAKAKAGPDWVCQFCGNTSPSSTNICTGCGSSRDSGKKRKVKEIKDKPVAKSVEPPKPLHWGVKAGIGVLAVLLLIIAGLSCSESEAKLKITGNHWKRTAELQEYKTVKETAWESEMPAGAQVISKNREIRKYDKVRDGYETVEETYTEKVKSGEKKVKDKKIDLGNGRFKYTYKMVPQYKKITKTRTVEKPKYKRVPVHENKVTYNIDKWVTLKELSASGSDEKPYWPEAEVSGSSPPQIGDTRINKKSEYYKVTAKKITESKEFDIDKLLDKPLTYEQFMKLRKGTEWSAIFSGLGELLEIKFKKADKQ